MDARGSPSRPGRARAGPAHRRRAGDGRDPRALASGCGAQQTVTSTPAASAPPATPSPDARRPRARLRRHPAHRRRRLGLPGAGDGRVPAGLRREQPGVTAVRIVLGSLVYSALYRYDAHYNAIPDLADGPCAPRGDGTVIRCRLIETTFHDGTPLTADDVAYTYGVFLRPSDLTRAPSAA